MVNKKNKYYILLFLIVLILCGGIGFTKSKIKSLNSFKEIVFPSLNIKYGKSIYYVNTEEGFLYKTYNNGKKRLGKDRIDKVGIIIFEDKLFYVDRLSKKICSMSLEGKDKREIGDCNIIMPYQPAFKLGKHVYYYDCKNILIRINSLGICEKLSETDNRGLDFLYHISAYSTLCQGILYTSDDRGIFAINLETGVAKKICSDFANDKIKIVNNYIYYVNNHDLRLYGIDIKGENRKIISYDKILSLGTDFDSVNFYVYGNNVFYTCNNDIIKFNTIHKSREIIVKNVVYFTMTGNDMYYISSYDGGGLFKFKIGNKKIQRIAIGNFIPYIEVWDDFVFYGVKCEKKDGIYDGEIKHYQRSS